LGGTQNKDQQHLIWFIADRTSQLHRSVFPTLFAMAMDYLPIQATSVSSERVFSSSAETDTMRRNHISPVLMEALQMVKFHLKKQRLSFTSSWMTPEKDMTIDSPDEDLLGALKSAKGQDAVNVIQEQIIQYIVEYEE
jgi:hypothetical protein